MNSFNRMENFKFIIKRVKNPVDFSLLRSSDAFLKVNSDISRIKKVLSIVLHERCSSHADFIYNRSFYSQPTLENKYHHWNLGMGKALYRGFYSCPIFTNGTHKLLINLDGESLLLIRHWTWLNIIFSEPFGVLEEAVIPRFFMRSDGS